MNKSLIIIAAVLAVVGCDRPYDDNMRHWVSEDPHIMTDEDGRRYVVEFHMGNVYSVKPLRMSGGK
jgi:Tfp pilus assembly protein PilP